MKRGNTLLTMSAYHGHLEIIKFLIEEAKVDPNQTNDEGKSPLLICTEMDYLDILKYLIEEIKVKSD